MKAEKGFNAMFLQGLNPSFLEKKD